MVGDMRGYPQGPSRIKSPNLPGDLALSLNMKWVSEDQHDIDPLAQQVFSHGSKASDIIQEENNESFDSQENEEDEEEENDQIRPEHVVAEERYQRSFYYGGSPFEDMPSTERFSMPLTEICVEAFILAKANPTSSPIDQILANKGNSKVLDKSSIEDAYTKEVAKISKAICTNPTSLLIALLYLERIRMKNPSYLRTVSHLELFVVSLMVAAKYLYDDGEDESVCSSDWAESAEISQRSLNCMEVNYLNAIDWSLYVSNEQFEKMTRKVETAIAKRQVLKRGGWTTYSDLVVLAANIKFAKTLNYIADCALKITTVCAIAYTASLTTMIGSIVLLNKTPLGSSTMSSHLGTKASLPVNTSRVSPISSFPVASDNDGEDENSSIDLMPTASDVLAASVAFATLGAAKQQDGGQDSNDSFGDPDSGQNGTTSDESNVLGNESASLLDSIGRHLAKSKWNELLSDDGGGGTDEDNDYEATKTPPGHHSTSVLLWPNKIRRSIYYLLTMGPTTESLNSLSPRLFDKCPILRIPFLDVNLAIKFT